MELFSVIKYSSPKFVFKFFLILSLSLNSSRKGFVTSGEKYSVKVYAVPGLFRLLYPILAKKSLFLNDNLN